MKRISKKVIFSLMPLFILILITETVCRIKYYYLHDRDPAYLLAPFLEPKIPFRHAPQRIITGGCPEDKLVYSPCRDEYLLMSYHEFDGYCWRGKEFSREKREGVYRILAVGGSSVECVNNADEETWVSLLEKKLNSEAQLAGRVEVINGGKVGNNAHYVNELLNNAGLDLNPDMVLYYEAYNETHSAIVDQRLRLLANSSLGWIHSQFYFTSMLYTYLIEKRQYMMIDDMYLTSSKHDSPKIYELVRNNFHKVLRNCKERSIDFVYVRQVIDYPLEKIGKSLTDIETLLTSLKELHDESFKRSQKSGFTLNDMLPLKQRLVNEIHTSIFMEERVPVIDPLPVF